MIHRTAGAGNVQSASTCLQITSGLGHNGASRGGSIMSDGLNRRDVLKMTAASLTVAAAGIAPAADAQPAAAAPPQNKRPLKKAYFGLPKGSGVVEQMKTLKEAGFDGIQLNLPMKGQSAEQLAEGLKQSGLKFEGGCGGEHWRLTLSNPDASIRKAGVDAFMEAMRQTKTLGGDSVLLVPGVVNESISYDDCYKRSQEEIRKMIPLANELGVKIAVENVWNNFILSPLEARRYLDEIESESVGWHLDLGNLLIYGWPEQWIRILGKRILKIHVKEYSRKLMDEKGPRAGFNVDLLEGSNNWQAIMKAFDDIGYSAPDHWATIEMGGGDLNRMKVLSEKLDKILAS
jgi:hexulose-6-phosphate isomerase